MAVVVKKAHLYVTSIVAEKLCTVESTLCSIERSRTRKLRRSSEMSVPSVAAASSVSSSDRSDTFASAMSSVRTSLQEV